MKICVFGAGAIGGLVGAKLAAAGAAEVGAHKTSMLQDLELGRPMEIDALVTAVQEFGRMTGHPTPTIDLVLALVRQRAEVAGCYSQPVSMAWPDGRDRNAPRDQGGCR